MRAFIPLLLALMLTAAPAKGTDLASLRLQGVATGFGIQSAGLLVSGLVGGYLGSTIQCRARPGGWCSLQGAISGALVLESVAIPVAALLTDRVLVSWAAEAGLPSPERLWLRSVGWGAVGGLAGALLFSAVWLLVETDAWALPSVALLGFLGGTFLSTAIAGGVLAFEGPDNATVAMPLFGGSF